MKIYNSDELKKAGGEELLELFEEFVRWNHYEATNEFDHLKVHSVTRDDVFKELLSRLK